MTRGFFGCDSEGLVSVEVLLNWVQYEFCFGIQRVRFLDMFF